MLTEAPATILTVTGGVARLRVEPPGRPSFQLPLGPHGDASARPGDRLRVAYRAEDPATLTVLAAAA